MKQFFIYIGIIFVFCGIFWPYVKKIPLGRFPGDLIIQKPHFKIYIPFTSMIIISITLSLIFWFFRNK